MDVKDWLSKAWDWLPKVLHLLLSLSVWALIVYGAWFVFSLCNGSGKPDLLLDVSPDTNKIKVKARALANGITIREGTVQLIVEKKRGIYEHQMGYLSNTATISNSGIIKEEFAVKPSDVRLIRGRLFVPDKEGAAAETVFPPSDLKPIKGKSIFFWIWVLLGIYAVVLIFTFTGDLTRGKLHIIMILMYFMTFLSIIAPSSIAFLLHYYPGSAQDMELSPIGLVRGTAENISEPQWVLNVGGTIVKSPAGITNSPSEAGNALNAKNRTAVEADHAHIKGGVVVPFYVIWLAMLGAGINMSRRVPRFQVKYAKIASEDENNDRVAILKRVVKTLDFLDGERLKDQKGAAEVRGNLIRNFMYLSSAPFLGITVYFLLRVAGTEVSFPAMVIMAFFAGFKSDTVIKHIVEFGEDALKVKEREQEVKEREDDTTEKEETLKKKEKELSEKEAALNKEKG